MKLDLAIIGAGASGLMCACYLAFLKKSGAVPEDFSFVLIERNSRPGKKLLLTGSGRCNLTNVSASYKDYNCDASDRLKKILDAFTPDDCLLFLEKELGLSYINKEDLIYPATQRSATVLDAFRFYLADNGVKIIFDTKVNSIKKYSDSYLIQTEDDTSDLSCDRIVIATGGLSYPKTGSDGSGLVINPSILKSNIITPDPALVPLTSPDKDIRKLSGTSVSCRLSTSIENKSYSEDGTLLFTDYGISGICVMILSGHLISYAREKGRYPDVYVDFLSKFSREEAEREIRTRLKSFSRRNLTDALSGLLRNNVIDLVIKRLAIAKDIKAEDLNDDHIRRLVSELKAFKIRINGNTGFDNSQVTRGGIRLSDLDDDLCFGDKVYYCGEIVNVDGPCGGYNLQWAWSSAVTVARAIGGSI